MWCCRGQELCGRCVKCCAGLGKQRGSYFSHSIGALRAAIVFSTASETSGPMPSPGIKVTMWGLASPGEGTYVMMDLACRSTTRFRGSLTKSKQHSSQLAAHMLKCLVRALGAQP